MAAMYQSPAPPPTSLLLGNQPPPSANNIGAPGSHGSHGKHHHHHHHSSAAERSGYQNPMYAQMTQSQMTQSQMTGAPLHIGCHDKGQESPKESILERETWARREYYVNVLLDPRDPSTWSYTVALQNHECFKYRRNGTAQGSERFGDPSCAVVIGSYLGGYSNSSNYDLLLSLDNPRLNGNKYSLHTGKRGVAFLYRRKTKHFSEKHYTKLTHADEKTIQFFQTELLANIKEGDYKSHATLSMVDGRQGHLIDSMGYAGGIIRFNDKSGIVPIHKTYCPTTTVYDMGSHYWVEEKSYEDFVNDLRAQCIDVMPAVDLTTLTFKFSLPCSTPDDPNWLDPGLRLGSEIASRILQTPCMVSCTICLCYSLRGIFIPGAGRPSSQSRPHHHSHHHQQRPGYY